MSSDYPFEHLNPERFQDFCQALLAKEFPGVQCFPVAQPDGGRDAFLYQDFYRTDAKGIIFQVKFARKPSEIADPVEWLTAIADGEQEKVKRLVSAGAKTYYLMTNVDGSAHFEVGKIDRVQNVLAEKFGINAHCLWRTDLCRRLDDAWNLKWTYPELMTGPDLIRYVIETGLNDHATRRANAIRAFVRSQYALDEKVKFKQIDLQNRLLDLFVDVPLTHPNSFSWPSDVVMANYNFGYNAPETKLGAASLLLRGPSANAPKFFVLEGAPGQGKSTISQYVSQVNRIRLLELAADIERVPAEHRSAGIELPIKADLRDFATWLARRNPFGAHDSSEHLQDWMKTLEAFLAALIRFQSGGASFDVSDLHAILSRSAAIVVLDGLDEVADVRRRAEVVLEIAKGVERLGAISASLRVVVTSRPAAFANSPGLKRETFSYVSLGDLGKRDIMGYAEKWLLALRASEADAVSVRKILNQKLDQPHIRDLARNPMQLAILLTLIHTKGVSLPDKRTALYDSYVDLFFSREAEKSEIVRKHRELLLMIHRYLAWLLHSEAELSNTASRRSRSNGSIEEARLREVVRNFLVSDLRDDSLVESLFTGVVERVVALVSRVEGTYEFEVQPLREFFAARYLYETAPYSPTGREKKGTKPDRFNAISRNFYWLNVTRFFAGCYSVGELAALKDSLKELLEDSDFERLRHPRVLAATFLGDWVFSQQNKAVAAVAGLLTDELGFRLLLVHASSRSGDGQTISFPRDCGGDQIVEYGFLLLKQRPPLDLAIEIAGFLRGAARAEDLLAKWIDALRRTSGDDVERWLQYGDGLGCLSMAPFEIVTDVMKRAAVGPAIVGLLLGSGRSDLLEYREEHFRAAIDASLDLEIEYLEPTPKRLASARPISRLAATLNPYRFARVFHESATAPLDRLELGRAFGAETPVEIEPGLTAEYAERRRLLEFLKNIEPIGQISTQAWQSSLGPWSLLIDEITKAYGDRDISFLYALIAASRTKEGTGPSEASDFFDQANPLLQRVGYALERRDAVKWWAATIARSKAENLGRVCSAWIVSAGRETLQKTCADMDAALTQLSAKQWEATYRLVRFCHAHAIVSDVRKSGAGWQAFSGLSPRTKILLTLRFSVSDALEVRRELLDNVGVLDMNIRREIQGTALRLLGEKSASWQKALLLCHELYLADVVSEKDRRYQYQHYGFGDGIRSDVADEIMKNPAGYPTLLLAQAERIYHAKVAKKSRPIAEIATAEKWFESGNLEPGR